MATRGPGLLLPALPISFTVKLIQNLARSGVAVILVTHTMPDVWQVATRIVVLTRGEKALEGKTGELTEERVVRAMLVGRESDA